MKKGRGLQCKKKIPPEKERNKETFFEKGLMTESQSEEEEGEAKKKEKERRALQKKRKRES